MKLEAHSIKRKYYYYYSDIEYVTPIFEYVERKNTYDSAPSFLLYRYTL